MCAFMLLLFKHNSIIQKPIDFKIDNVSWTLCPCFQRYTWGPRWRPGWAWTRCLSIPGSPPRSSDYLNNKASVIQTRMLYTYPKVQKNGHTELYICWELGLDLLVRGSKKPSPRTESLLRALKMQCLSIFVRNCNK